MLEPCENIWRWRESRKHVCSLVRASGPESAASPTSASLGKIKLKLRMSSLRAVTFVTTLELLHWWRES